MNFKINRSIVLKTIFLTALLGINTISLIYAQPSIPHLKMGKSQAVAYLEENDVEAHPDNLHGYAVNSKANAVIAMLASGVDPNHKGSLPQSPLYMASVMACISRSGDLNDQLRTMDALISSGADVNANWAELNILTMSAQQCPGVIVKRLINAGAKIDAKSPQGFTPLSMALIVSNVEAATVLVEAGARISEAVAAKLLDNSNDLSPESKALIVRAKSAK
jgi:uncharacterized protein